MKFKNIFRVLKIIKGLRIPAPNSKPRPPFYRSASPLLPLPRLNKDLSPTFLSPLPHRRAAGRGAPQIM